MINRTLIFIFLFSASHAFAQTLTVAGGETIRSRSSRHDAYRAELNFGWKPELWRGTSWGLSLHHALSIMTFRDKNTVNAVSWAPNLLLAPNSRCGTYPWVQLGFGVAYLSDDEFKSEPRKHPMYPQEGTSDMGSHGQFESSIALGVTRGRFSIRAKVYHYSNANLSSNNQGMDVAELGLGYRF